MPAVIAPQPAEARAVLDAEAARLGAPRVVVGSDVVMSVDDHDRMAVTLGERSVQEPDDALRGAHQRQNAAVVAATLWALADAGKRVNVGRGAFEARWPGRLERIEADGKAWLLDAAHNPDGCRALARHLRERVPDRPRVLLFGAMADKDWPSMLEALRPEVDALVFSRSPLARAEDPRRFVERFGGEAIDDIDEAMRRAAGAGALVVVAGSIFLMAEVRARLLGVETDPPIAM